MPVTTRRRTSRSAAVSTCPASTSARSGDHARNELREPLVRLAGSGLRTGRDHGVALLLGIEDAPIPQLRHAVLLDERDLHEAVARCHVTDEEGVDEALGRDDLAVLAVEVDDMAP